MTLLLALLAGSSVVALLVITVRFLEAQAWQRSLVGYQFQLPTGLKPDDVATWLAGLAAATHAPRGLLLPPPPAVVEVVATAAGIQHRLFVPRSLAASLLSGLRAALPGARIEPLTSEVRPMNPPPPITVAAQLRLRGRDRQLAVDQAAAASQLQLAALQPLYGNEQVRWQWIVVGAATPPVVRQAKAAGQAQLPIWWNDAGSLDSEAVRAARLKQSQPLLHVTGRVVVAAADRRRAFAVFGRVWAPARLLNLPGAQLVRSWWPSFAVQAFIEGRALPLLQWPLYLNSRELAGLLAIPYGETSLPGVAASQSRQLPPVAGSTSGIVLADSNYPGMQQAIRISQTDRLMHSWIGGPTGVGKSTLLANLIIQDANNGDGLAVIDPKGDLVDDVLARMPAARQQDVIVLDPSDTTRPIGFNLLGLSQSEEQRELAVDNLLHILRELWHAYWGPRTEAVLHAALLTLTAAKTADGQAFTLCEVSELLTNPQFRRFVLDQPGIPATVVGFWRWYHSLSEGERTQVIGPVLNKLSAFTNRTSLRLVLGQSTGLDLQTAIRERKIILMPLSRGRLGAATASLLGSLLVASIWQAALGRIALPAEMRRPWWLYIDEAQEVVRLPLEIADMLAVARGLGVGVTFGNQYLSQLPEITRRAMLATVRSQIVFQVQPDDAKVLARSFAPTLTEADLSSLAAYEVALKLSNNGQSVRPMTGITRPLPPATADAGQLREASRQRYGVARADVEAALLARRSGPGGHQQHFGQRPRKAASS